MRSYLIRPILIFFILFSFVSIIQGDEKLIKAADIYDRGIELFYRGRYEEAIDQFSKLIQTFPQSKLVSYSHYMIGISLLSIDRFEEALQEFEFYLKTYPDGDRVKEVKRGVDICRKKIIIKNDKKEIPDEYIKFSEKKAVHIPPDVLKGEEVSFKDTKKIDDEKHGSIYETKKVKRRICAQIFYLDGRSLIEVEKRIKDLKKAGIDTIIFRVFQNKGDRVYKFLKPQNEAGVYFKTEHAPVVYDLLGKIVDISHQNGIDIFAWMTTRYADFGLEENPDYRCKIYNFDTKKVEVSRGYNLFHPDVLRRLEGIYRDLARYPIDGILLQDDLILRHNEDFSTEANKAFLKEYGFSPHPDNFYIGPYKSDLGKYYVKAYTERFWIWANWKNRWLMNVAKRLISNAKEVNPSLQFGINMYYEAVLNHSNAVAWFSQDLGRAIENGFDYYAIMAYHRQTMRELNIEKEKAIKLMADVSQKAINMIGDPSKVLMKIQILDWKVYDIIPENEVNNILLEILKHGNVSLAFVPYIQKFPLHLLKDKWSRF